MREKYIALTFDDGPSKYTNGILNILERCQSRATFFLVGKNVKSYPEEVNQMVRIGCELGNHTFSHQRLTLLNREHAHMEWDRCDEAIFKACGKYPTLARCPYYVWNDEILREMKLPCIKSSVDPRDWDVLDEEKIVEHVKDHVYNGCIVIMHDCYPTTLEATQTLIPWLQSDGYRLLTVSELAKRQHLSLKSGNYYRDILPPSKRIIRKTKTFLRFSGYKNIREGMKND